jgi:hypothetical protein
MNDFIAGPASAADDDGESLWGGSGPPPVLLAALGVALLIAIVLVALVAGGGGSAAAPLPAGKVGVDDPGAAATPTDSRVLLTLSIEGGGSGKVTMKPSGGDCTETCEHDFAAGSRVTVTAKAVKGSRFEGWDDACTGSGTCTFVMDRERSLTATFEGTPAVSQCSDGVDNDGDKLVDDADPGCRGDNTEAPDNRVVPQPALDCSDGVDNDGDGLIDTAQDPGCTDGTESDSTTPPPASTTPAVQPPTTTAPPPPATSTTTTTTTPVPPGTTVSECRDGRDNDGDGLVDRPADPGCDSDGTEAGG